MLECWFVLWLEGREGARIFPVYVAGSTLAGAWIWDVIKHCPTTASTPLNLVWRPMLGTLFWRNLEVSPGLHCLYFWFVSLPLVILLLQLPLQTATANQEIRKSYQKLWPFQIYVCAIPYVMSFLHQLPGILHNPIWPNLRSFIRSEENSVRSRADIIHICASKGM